MFESGTQGGASAVNQPQRGELFNRPLDIPGNSPLPGGSGDMTGGVDPNVNQEPGVNDTLPGGEQGERSDSIPRPRFDGVLAERNQLRQDREYLMAQNEQLMQMAAANQPQPGPQDGPPQPQRVVPPDFNDPEVGTAWSEKFGRDPLGTMAELSRVTADSRVQEFESTQVQAMGSQLAAIKQDLAQRHLDDHYKTRGNDQVFSAIRPVFDRMVQHVHTAGQHEINPDSLRAIEVMALAEASRSGIEIPASSLPFTESPGSATGLQGRTAGALTPGEARVAQRFGISEADYARELQAIDEANMRRGYGGY